MGGVPRAVARQGTSTAHHVAGIRQGTVHVYMQSRSPYFPSSFCSSICHQLVGGQQIV